MRASEIARTGSDRAVPPVVQVKSAREVSNAELSAAVFFSCVHEKKEKQRVSERKGNNFGSGG